MTKKDYEAIADALQRVPGIETGTVETKEVLAQLCRVFACDNPRFDAARFRRACTPGANVKARR